MLLAKYTKGTLTTSYGAQISYVMMGEGTVPLVVVPGMSDGLHTVNELAPTFSWTYRNRAAHYRILVLSRRQPIPIGYSAEQHASDMVWALDQLQWGQTLVEGISIGGAIAQWIAFKRPQQVRGLILTSTTAMTGRPTRAMMKRWIMQSQQARWAELNWDYLSHLRPGSLPMYQVLRPFLGMIGQPAYPGRLERTLESMLYLDTRHLLPTITSPTLIIAGARDSFISIEEQQEMARHLRASRMKVFAEAGHDADQSPEYQPEMDRFATEVITLASQAG